MELNINKEEKKLTKIQTLLKEIIKTYNAVYYVCVVSLSFSMNTVLTISLHHDTQ